MPLIVSIQQEIPSNIFIIASCNPHRGHSLTTLNKRCLRDAKEDISWLTGTYNVQKLHPTFDILKWDYGSLNSIQEDEYIIAKLRMIELKLSDEQVSSLSELISLSQEKMREYAEENILKSLEYEDISGLGSSDIKMVASKCAESSVSQRDIQRVFHFYQWVLKTFTIESRKQELCGKNLHERAMLLSLGLVYYMRLSSVYREKYQTFLQDQGYCFSEVYDEELQWLIEQVDLPQGIAKTKALKENLYAVVACTATRTPLIIVGDPGSSKTLSFNIAMSNVQGKQSKKNVFRITDIYHSLLPFFYQCSRRTTSFEIERVFKRATDRQRSLAEVPLPVYCVVFMDEAGLPEHKMESLKVLHYYLDAQEVSFVAISNHILDAAKTNRAVSLFRPKALNDDLQELATQCIMTEQSAIAPNEKQQMKQFCTPKEKQQIKQLCSAFEELMKHNKFRKLYGLRDFIHFIRYLKSHRVSSLNAQLLLNGIERNFNGSRNFADVCQIFFSKVGLLQFATYNPCFCVHG